MNNIRQYVIHERKKRLNREVAWQDRLAGTSIQPTPEKLGLKPSQNHQSHQSL